MAFTARLIRPHRLVSTSTKTFGERIRRESDLQRTSLCIEKPFLIQNAHFHHQNIIHFYTQSAHGILLEALQKPRVYTEVEEKVPDELKRLKAGSLKWLFDVWPTPIKSFSSLTKKKALSLVAAELENAISQGSPDGEKSPKRSQRSQSDIDQLNAIVDYLKKNNIAIRRLIRLPWLLSADPDVVDKAVERVQRRLKLKDFNVAISFVNLPDSKLVDTALVWNRDAVILSKKCKGNMKRLQNRIDVLAHSLKCPPEDASDMIAKVNNMLTMPLERIETVLDTLLDGGVKPEGIVADPWIFINNVSKMKTRLKILKENDIIDYKPWSLRASQKNFDSYIKAELVEREILAGHKSVGGFLQDKLNCNEAVIKWMFSAAPSIKGASATKLNEMIEFLLSAGFSTRQIRSAPKILAHSVETISSRIAELSEHNVPITNLLVLCRTSKDFQKGIRNLEKFQQTTDIKTAVES